MLYRFKVETVITVGSECSSSQFPALHRAQPKILLSLSAAELLYYIICVEGKQP